MGKVILTFGDIEIEKKKVYWHKSPNFLENISIWQDVFRWIKLWVLYWLSV